MIFPSIYCISFFFSPKQDSPQSILSASDTKVYRYILASRVIFAAYSQIFRRNSSFQLGGLLVISRITGWFPGRKYQKYDLQQHTEACKKSAHLIYFRLRQLYPACWLSVLQSNVFMFTGAYTYMHIFCLYPASLLLRSFRVQPILSCFVTSGLTNVRIHRIG